MNVDKSSEAVFGFSDGDESWETLNNTSCHTRWKDDDFESTKVNDKGETYPAWQDDFEARFPDLDDPYKDTTKLKQLATWLKSTTRTEQVTTITVDPETGEQTSVTETVNRFTNDPITPVTYNGVTYNRDTADYRLAKFKAEIGNYMELNDIIFDYVYKEAFLMVD